MTYRTPDLAMPAKEHYSPNLEYHNWQHAEDVMVRVLELAKEVRVYGIELDATVLEVAAAWHDAGFAEDHTALGFKTKEHDFAYLAKQYLKTRGQSNVFIEKVVTAILGTIHHAEREDLHALALHRADIANIGGPYAAFYRNTTLLYHEARYFCRTPTWNDWVIGTGRLIDDLVREANVELPRLGKDTALFTNAAYENKEKLGLERGPKVL